jgi:Flp pilus assembly protein TadG
MMKHLRIFRDSRGLGAVEFALVAPALFTLIIGITQLGVLYFANADLRNAVAAGARYASIFPRPSEDAIKQRTTQQVARLQTGKLSAPKVTYAMDANGYQYAEIEMSYNVPLDFVLFKSPAVTLVERRRVFLQPTS